MDRDVRKKRIEKNISLARNVEALQGKEKTNISNLHFNEAMITWYEKEKKSKNK